MAEIPRRAVHRPRLTGFFIEADAQATAFLPQIAFAAGVHHMREFAARFQDVHDFGDVIGDQILVRHRQQRQVNPGHGANLARPKAACVHQMLGDDGALFGHHFPRAIGARVGLQDAVVQHDLGPAHPRGLGIGVGGARGVEVAVERVIQGADDAFQVHHAVGELVDLFRPEDLGIQPHIAVLGALGLELVEPRLIVGQRDAADMVQPAGHAGDRLQFLIKADGIALQRRHVGVAVQGVEPARRVPGGAGGQLRPFDQHHIGPAQFGQVVKNRTADDATADDQNAGMGFHVGDSCNLGGDFGRSGRAGHAHLRQIMSQAEYGAPEWPRPAAGCGPWVGCGAGGAYFSGKRPLGANRKTRSSTIPSVISRVCAEMFLRSSSVTGKGRTEVICRKRPGPRNSTAR